MLFTTDRQTIEDLNIFGKHGRDGVFTMFNRTRTVMGEALLKEMLRYPLADIDAINRRSQQIRYFKTVQQSFPFDVSLFDSIEEYIGNKDVRTKLSTDRPDVEQRIARLIAVDNNLKTIQSGVGALIRVVHKLKDFLYAVLDTTGSPFRNDPDMIGIGDLLHSGIFKQMLDEQPEEKLPHEKLVIYDGSVRFQDLKPIRKLLDYIACLDVYIAVGAVTRERGFVFAHANPPDLKYTLIEGFYHPEIKGAVSNTLKITPDSNTIFLTGANMAGKSTFMKSLGIAMYLAHVGFSIAATKMEFSVMNGIFTTINLSDDLGSGASHFYAEVLRVKKVARELRQSKRLFVIFDELFRGTNVKDAYEATVAVTSAFATKLDSIFLISTHIIEAGEVLREQRANISFRYLPTYMDGHVPRYTYKLEHGITEDRHGMLIINNEGILDILRNGKIKPSIS